MLPFQGASIGIIDVHRFRMHAPWMQHHVNCTMCAHTVRRSARTTILEHHLYEKTFVVETRLVGERPLPGDPRVSTALLFTAPARPRVLNLVASSASL